jgi:hypothetical protein
MATEDLKAGEVISCAVDDLSVTTVVAMVMAKVLMEDTAIILDGPHQGQALRLNGVHAFQRMRKLWHVVEWDATWTYLREEDYRAHHQNAVGPKVVVTTSWVTEDEWRALSVGEADDQRGKLTVGSIDQLFMDPRDESRIDARTYRDPPEENEFPTKETLGDA